MRRTLTLPIIILLAYTASVCLNASFHRYLLPPKAETDIIQRIFGSLRTFVGDWAFMRAEEYHHRGLPFEEALAYHSGESMLTEVQQHEGEHEEGHETNKAQQQNMNLYQKLYTQVKVTVDSHLKPAEEKEVLPWFYIEVAFNPHDIRGYVLGGYWLDRIGKREEGLKFLRKGESNNPGSAQILSAIGELYFKEKNYEKAAMYLEHSCRLWLEAKSANRVTNKYEENDRLFAFSLLADIYSKREENKKALQLYQELLKFGPNPVAEQKIKRIEGGS